MVVYLKHSFHMVANVSQVQFGIIYGFHNVEELESLGNN